MKTNLRKDNNNSIRTYPSDEDFAEHIREFYKLFHDKNIEKDGLIEFPKPEGISISINKIFHLEKITSIIEMGFISEIYFCINDESVAKIKYDDIKEIIINRKIYRRDETL